jgi:WD40 repeat protein
LGRAAALDTFPNRRHELRDEAIATSTLVDLRPTRDWDLGGPASRQAELAWFDSKLERYARREREGVFGVHRTSDRAALRRLVVPVAEEYWPIFSPDGRFLYIGYDAKTRPPRYGVWDLETGKPITGLPHIIRDFAFRPAGRRALISLDDGTVAQYELPSGTMVQTWNAGQPIQSLTFNPDGTRLAARLERGSEIRVYEPETGRVLRTFAHPILAIGSMTWRGDGRVLAAAFGNKINLWDTADGELISVLEGHQSSVVVLAFNRRGDLLASGSWDGSTRLWDGISGRELIKVPGTFLGWGPEGRSLVTAHDSNIIFHEVASGLECRTLRHGLIGNRTPPLPNGPWCVDFSSDGRLLASASVDGVRIFRAADGAELAHLSIGHCESVMFQPDRGLFTYNRELGLASWPAREGPGGVVVLGPPTLEKLPPSRSQTCHNLARDERTQRLLLTDRSNGQAVLINTVTPTSQTLLRPHTRISKGALSPDGRWAATGTWSGTDVKIWDTTTGTVRKQWPSTDATVAFSPDGHWFATCHDGYYRLFQVGSWQPGPVLATVARTGAYPMAFRFDGHLLAIVTSKHGEHAINLVDPSNGRELAVLQAPEALAIVWLAFSPDGRQLAAATTSHRVQLWDLPLVCQRLEALGLDRGFPVEPHIARPATAVPPVTAVHVIEAEPESIRTSR